MSTKILTDNEIDDRLKRALLALGDDPGETITGNAALKAARKALIMLSLALIAAGLKRDEEDTTSTPWPWPLP